MAELLRRAQTGCAAAQESLQAPDANGWSPLHAAAAASGKGAADCVRMLLEAGADCGAVNHAALKALQLAVQEEVRRRSLRSTAQLMRAAVEGPRCWVSCDATAERLGNELRRLAYAHLHPYGVSVLRACGHSLTRHRSCHDAP